MRKLSFLFGLFLFGGYYVNAQVIGEVDHYRTKTFDDAIFSKNVPLSLDTPLNRFTPTRMEIDSAEKALNKLVSDTVGITTNSIYIVSSTSSFPGDFQRWFKDYSKQFFGMINEKGERILLINGLYSNKYDSLLINWLHEPVSVPGIACVGHWNAKYNLSSGKLSDLELDKLIYSTPQPAKGIDHYKSKLFDVAIFSKNNGVLADTNLKRFTPEREQIDKVEASLQNQKYDIKCQRQYFGYIESNGNRILLINCFRVPEMAYFWLKVPMIIDADDAPTWNIKYNLNSSKFFNYKKGSTSDCYDYKGIYHYKTPNIDVAIFPKGGQWIYESKGNQEFTPTKEQVHLVEEKLLKLKGIVSPRDTIDYFISTHLIGYKRQYFGCIDKNGDGFLFINCFLAGGFSTFRNPWGWILGWLNNEVAAVDGGDAYWQVYYNLSRGKFFDLTVNGNG